MPTGCRPTLLFEQGVCHPRSFMFFGNVGCSHKHGVTFSQPSIRQLIQHTGGTLKLALLLSLLSL